MRCLAAAIARTFEAPKKIPNIQEKGMDFCFAAIFLV
jgi:hypothetical protein